MGEISPRTKKNGQRVDTPIAAGPEGLVPSFEKTEVGSHAAFGSLEARDRLLRAAPMPNTPVGSFVKALGDAAPSPA